MVSNFFSNPLLLLKDLYSLERPTATPPCLIPAHNIHPYYLFVLIFFVNSAITKDAGLQNVHMKIQRIRHEVIYLGILILNGRSSLYASSARSSVSGRSGSRSRYVIATHPFLFNYGLLVLIAVDFYVTDGKMFYTNEMEGHGNKVAVGFIVFILFSLPVIGNQMLFRFIYYPLFVMLTLGFINLVVKVNKTFQWTVLEMILYFDYSILLRMLCPEERKKTGFLFPSAVVFSIVGIIALLLQCWWLFIFIDAMFFEDISIDRRISDSSQNSKRQTLPVFKNSNVIV
uniref:GPI ethanolamine phosphate transferase 1 n=1 Tax=Heterorhabditis bacteriophora TaxID=37862 RepID=A0A1I7WQJ4_HETBA